MAEARKLDSALAAGGELTTLVVSHFDADHWMGLRALAEIYSGSRVPHIAIVYPDLPAEVDRLAADTVALIATARGETVRAMDLITAWRSRGQVLPVPVHQGEWFEAAGRSWRVAWPPPVLPPNQGRWIRRALDELDELASRLAEQGLPRLRQNLDEAYPRAFPAARSVERADPGAEDDRAEAADQIDRYLSDDGDGDQDLDERTPERGDPGAPHRSGLLGHSLESLPTDAFPEEARPLIRRLAATLGRANNYLSLVMVDEHDDLLACGDVQGWALKAASFDLDGHYRVMLAPHHGTVPFPRTVQVGADLCIAQAGSDHVVRWHRHLSSHPDSACVSTAIVGSVTLTGHYS